MNLPILGSRLAACCSYIRPGSVVADIGCDHGYLGIYLILKGIAKSVIAADINQQPLDSAYRNAHKYCVQEKISFHLSDGAKNIPQEFDTLVCAGMGADTIISILEGAPWLQSDKYQLVLQCQSRRPELRKYLYDHGWHICTETLAKDGKFIYPVMSVAFGKAEPLTPGGYHITPALLAGNDPLLPEFYDRVLEGIKTTVQGLSKNGGEKFRHYNAVLQELQAWEDDIHGNS